MESGRNTHSSLTGNLTKRVLENLRHPFTVRYFLISYYTNTISLPQIFVLETGT